MPTDAISSDDMIDVQDDDAVEFSAVNEEELEEEVGSDNVFEHMYDNIYREPLFGKPSELSPIETRKLLPRLSEKIGKDFFLCGELHRVTDVYVSSRDRRCFSIDSIASRSSPMKYQKTIPKTMIQ